MKSNRLTAAFYLLIPNLYLLIPNSYLLNAQGVSINNDGTAAGAGIMLDIKGATDDNTSHGIQVKNNSGTAIMAVRSDGNVGIGTVNPASVMEVEANQPYIKLDGTASSISWDVGSNIFSAGADNFVIGQGSTPVITAISGGNVGIGTISPGAPLDIANNKTTSGDHVATYFRGHGNFYHFAIGHRTNGTANTAALLSTQASLPLIFKTNSTDRITIAADGNVGIGTSPSVAKLHISGGATSSTYKGLWLSTDNTSSSLSTSMLLSATGSATDEPSISFHNGTQGTIALIKGRPTASTDGGLDFYTREAGVFRTSMSLVNDGNVGVGTTIPSQRLDVASVGLPTSAGERVANMEAYNAGDGILFGHTNSKATGSIGALSGNGAPYLQFFAYHSNNHNSSRYSGDPYPGADVAYPGRILSDNGTANNVFIFQSGDDPGQDNEVTWTSRMVINEGGNIGVGTTAPNTKLAVGTSNTPQSVNSTIITETAMEINSTGDAWLDLYGTANGGNKWTVLNNNNAGDPGELAFQNGNTTRMVIFPGGNVGIGTTSPGYKLEVCGDVAARGTLRAITATVTGGLTACSDIRYKKNISSLSNSLSNLMKLNGVNYDWKINEFPEKGFTDSKQIGFIAQEVEKFYPEVVMTDKEGYKSVDYSRFTPILLEAIKEQQQIIEKQDDKITRLETENRVEWKALKVENNELRTEIEEIKALLNQTGSKN